VITFAHRKFHTEKITDIATQQNENMGHSRLIRIEPKRKLKHFYQDPLILVQEKVRDTLLALHVDTIQHYQNGKSYVIIGGKVFCTGALLNEHPKIQLEKIGKCSLYFSDKYSQ
jgi:hypothetical protein